MVDVSYLIPGGPPLNKSLGFVARAVTVDNYTANYVNIDSGRPCPPYTVGWVTQLFSGNQAANASLAPAVGTPPAPAPPSNPVFNAILTYTDQVLPPSNGVSLVPTVVNIGSTGSVTVLGGSVGVTGTVQVNLASQSGTINVQFPSTQNVNILNTPAVTISSGTVAITGTPNINIQSQSVVVNVALPWTSVGTKTTVGTGSENFTTSAVPAGTQTLGILVEAGHFITQLVVSGVTSSAFYLDSTTAAPFGGIGRAGWITIPINASRDSTYVITWGTSSVAGTIISAYASSLAMGYPTLGQQPMASSVPVVLAVDQTPNLWQAPNKVPFFSRQVGAGTSNQVAAVAGQTVYLHQLTFSTDVINAGGFAAYEDTASNLISQISLASLGHVSENMHGAPLTPGLGTKLVVLTGGDVGVTCVYSQG